jgi:hypothetical protein
MHPASFLLCLLLFFSIAADKTIAANNCNQTIVSLAIKIEKPVCDANVINIPLKRAGRLYLIEAKIDGQEGNLVFDTGATGLVVNKTYFRKYTGSTKTTGGVTGSIGQVQSSVIDSINYNGIYYNRVTADIANLGHIEDRRGVKILGLLGLNMIDGFEIVFNARRNLLILHKIDIEGNCLDKEAGTMKFEYTQKLSVGNSMMSIRAYIGEKELTFCLDTGAEVNLMHSGLPKKVLNTVTISRSSNLGGAGSGTVKAVYGEMNEFELARCKFGKMQTAIINLTPMSESYGFSIDGMLGFDFWQKGVFRINFKKRQIDFSLEKEVGNET